nr:PREDICTED: uncharacterized protein LOC103313764 [Tribolium castaneum]XP_015837943.1 PREDICTED: uncharacterized protein LOC103313764 [Tribolium castaneum]XP_015837944.1 PREDICTED: uncharacterized protein LOC103313764 [Tribolium castaneum]|eukprot:XP_008196089.1 PREDICTED: uncharacterized protein LOC103313764 [Tribolium castaneum]
MDDFTENKSGEALESIENLMISINKLSIFNISQNEEEDTTSHSSDSGGTYIPLPIELKGKGSCFINIFNKDNYCFVYSILAALFPVNHSKYERVESYPSNVHEILNLKNIEMPVKIKDISKFEKQNPTISINVFKFNEKTRQIDGPIYHTKNVKEKHINLLYLTKNEHQIFFCDRCLQHIPSKSKDKIDRHKRDCSTFPAVKTSLPEPNSPESLLHFSQFKSLLRLPFVIYADFECLTVPLDTCYPNTKNSFTNPYQKHVAYSIAYFIKCSFDSKLDSFKTYRGEKPQEWFISELKEICKFVNKILLKQKKILNKPLSELEKELHETTNNCNLCGCNFIDNNKKVIHHNHLTGEFISTICNNCNLQIQISNKLPVFLHNLSGYDAHLFITEFINNFSNTEIIPLNHENYISFSGIHCNMKITFLDSFRFLPTSLDKLVSFLKLNQFSLMKAFFPNVTDDVFQLLLKKGVFPYDYITSSSVFEDT